MPTNRVHCKTEYDTLKKVIVCSPKYMTIKNAINETQKLFKDENIDVDIAKEQHERFVQVLKENEIDVIELPPEEKFHEQVFTRDIGYCIGEQLFATTMGQRVRAGEVEVLMKELNKRDLPYTLFDELSLEGGDVIIDGEKIWVGISDRTTIEAIRALQDQLPTYKITPIPIAERILHLDCAFNIIGPETAIIFPEAFGNTEYSLLSQNYHLIEITKNEELTLGTNVLSIGQKKVISMPQNKQVNQAMSKMGYQIIEVDFSEIIKSGGSFRCCSLPLLRG
ncbi:dimethylarginine dimethylaminohydrolase family protein [Aquibacillus albus]|uniref:N-dimethylarginine dimethylaminohydrolase n=1 Tax=Aquibacillus albus TaxID=1168171 RepID=A0ABS2N2S2_9BACI|nr:arginine deiminase family protein [Aquibacillus albus]MBM7572437.1 N-dimethylarginine dimethylaminohydrolase [Aquibacillus albus]